MQHAGSDYTQIDRYVYHMFSIRDKPTKLTQKTAKKSMRQMQSAFYD